MESLKTFFHMGGYALYVWGAYGSVLVILLAQWFIPWRRWHLYKRERQKLTHE